ncbi:MAG TPA: glycosyltransferase family 39 protein [Ktedonobacterales bacterium]
MRSRQRQAPVSQAIRPAAPVARRGPRRWLLALAALFVTLLALDALLYQVRLPVSVSADGDSLTVAVAGAAPVGLPLHARIVSVAILPRDPLIHEYQLDGTDSANNFTLDTTYLKSIANTPYYRFYAWMRDLDGLSRWRDLCAGAHCVDEPPLSGARILAPTGAGAQRISAQVQRAETPIALTLLMSDRSVVTLTIDRNDHYVDVTRSAPGQPDDSQRTFFPADAAPFAAVTADFIVRLALWALALLGLVCGGEWLVGLALGALSPRSGASDAGDPTPAAEDVIANDADDDVTERASLRPPRGLSASAGLVRAYQWTRRASSAGWRALTQAIHPIGLVALAASFAFVVRIALAQYHALPHIYDAAAYLFGARIFAAGRLFAPVPALLNNFSGPFMVIHDGKWFPQYEPGASLTLAVGVRLGAPWLVEPLMGTLALLGIGLIARRLFDRRVATLAVLLGALSPFYSYLAASYLSHTIALFYLVWGWWALLRSQEGAARRGGVWYLPLAALLWLMALLTRDTSVIFIAVVAVGALWFGWRGWLRRGGGWPNLRTLRWRRWLAPTLTLLAILALGLDAYLGYNTLLTGSLLTTPRQLFFPGDHYGFGQGVGFYGQHTLAAGFVNVDELLASLAIDLYGWPFYLTLALLLIPFLSRRARAADGLLLLGAAAMTCAFIGYFYHGIYLGPRYLYESLPFFLILTARGLLTLAEAGMAARDRGARWGATLQSGRRRLALLRGFGVTRSVVRPAWASGGSLAGVLALALLACTFIYYLPRQIALHTDFTGMSAGRVIQMGALANPPLHHALLVTSDDQLYRYTLFALNDPLLQGDVLYAEASRYDDITALQRAFPGRQVYILIIRPDGQVSYTSMGSAP